MNLNKDTFNVIASMSDGDMRKAIMLLQNLKYICNDQTQITVENVYEIASCITKHQLDEIDDICIKSKSINVKKIINLTDKLKSSSYPIHNVLKHIHELVINSEKLTDKMKALISLHFARTEKRLIDGADEYLQLLSIFMCIKSVVLNADSIYNYF